MNTPKFVVFQKGIGWYWKLVAGNGRIMCSHNHRYASSDAARDGIQIITNLVKMGPKIVIE